MKKPFLTAFRRRFKITIITAQRNEAGELTYLELGLEDRKTGRKDKYSMCREWYWQAEPYSGTEFDTKGGKYYYTEDVASLVQAHTIDKQLWWK